MKQRGHTWIALRAIDLIAEDPKCKGLATILGGWAKHSYLGCWLPDMAKFKKGHGVVGNHTFKNAPYKGENKSRFVLERETLLCGLIRPCKGRTYKPGAKPRGPAKISAPALQGPHNAATLPFTVADRVALRRARFLFKYRNPARWAGLLCSRPSGSTQHLETAGHCEPISNISIQHPRYSARAIHCNWEKHWEKKIGTYFDKRNLICTIRIEKKNACRCGVYPRFGSAQDGRRRCKDSSYFPQLQAGTSPAPTSSPWFDPIPKTDRTARKNLRTTDDDSKDIIAAAKNLDKEFGVVFDKKLTWGDEKSDVWEMAICWCRASFAFICHVFPVKDYPYDGEEVPAFGDVFAGEEMTAKLAGYDRIIFQSAVVAVASTWKRIWGKF